MAEYGQRMRKEHFAFDPAYTPLNHGSYGAFPKVVRDHQRALQDKIEARSDPFIRFTIPKMLKESRAAAASLLGADQDDVVFVPNATTAINAVLRSLTFDDGDIIVYFSTAYGACEKTIQYICETTLATSKRIEVQFPLPDSELIATLRESIQALKAQGSKPKIAMFDTIVTFPGVRMPWEELVKVCQEENVLSLIDGAHGVGHIDLTHLTSVDPDFFTSNCYKWLYTPRACAIFYVPFRNQHLIRSSIPTSHGFQPHTDDEIDGLSSSNTTSRDEFGKLFQWAATIDQTPYLCVPAALAFRNQVCGGEERIRQYCFDLARKGGGLVAQKLRTETMQHPHSKSQDCCFTNVRLPLQFALDAVHGGLDPVQGPRIVKWIMDRALCEYNTWIPGKFYGGAAWVRMSAQMYLSIKDFEFAASVLKELCQRVERGEWRSPLELVN